MITVFPFGFHATLLGRNHALWFHFSRRLKNKPNHVTYYARRAPYYDELYAKPERQHDLTTLGAYLKTALADKKVLEIACGTGYWTQVIAQTATTVHATDINEPMLEIAREKPYPRDNVVFEACDMYDLMPGGGFDALFGGFIWSHIPLQELEAWLNHLHGLLKPGSKVVFTDNNFVPGSSTPITSPDDQGNIFQQRKLPDGQEYLVIKNFPELPDFERLLKKQGRNILLRNLEHYWMLEYDLA